ncbi:hypothetical protein SETIT_5G040800v2 [Setaria italica]|uniref:Uncharacterized protein n=1 Tax=Setaria italica TaxID=4555 RepID=A0A368R116_SETIT|nr:hypothetical protein SETIT_5G040800v2 [Setaria italica]
MTGARRRRDREAGRWNPSRAVAKHPLRSGPLGQLCVARRDRPARRWGRVRGFREASPRPTLAVDRYHRKRTAGRTGTPYQRAPLQVVQRASPRGRSVRAHCAQRDFTRPGTDARSLREASACIPRGHRPRRRSLAGAAPPPPPVGAAPAPVSAAPRAASSHLRRGRVVAARRTGPRAPPLPAGGTARGGRRQGSSEAAPRAVLLAESAGPRHARLTPLDVRSLLTLASPPPLPGAPSRLRCWTRQGCDTELLPLGGRATEKEKGEKMRITKKGESSGKKRRG